LKQKRDRYEMHKYWKKPSNDLKELIEKFSSVARSILDEFISLTQDLESILIMQHLMKLSWSLQV